MAVGVFEAQAHLWTIFLQVEELLAVERSSTLPGEHRDTSQERERTPHGKKQKKKLKDGRSGLTLTVG